MPAWLEQLNREVIACTRCPRLISHCRRVAQEKRRAYRDQPYWGRPVPGFGDPKARVLVIGLAPGAHGSNRTGRMFTGDGSGNFLYPVLHQVGFASQAEARYRNDNLRLHGAYITAVARCAPPANKPLPTELARCAPFLEREVAGLKDVRVVVALGKVAFDSYLSLLKRSGVIERRNGFRFAHGARYPLPEGKTLLASYHPSQQNTNTGKLTERMFLKVFRTAARLATR